MSAGRFLDDVARTLAEPMSRQRAIRIVGVSLVAATIPGLGPRVARAQSGVCTKTTCGRDQRCCQKGAEANFATYCCPRPSWQFQCGSQSNGYRCVNTCTGRNSFACTAVVEHRQSGINGVCCDRRFHSGCSRIGRPTPEKRPDGTVAPPEAWKPSCCPKGPGFGFCGGVCCEPPNRCKNGECRCPDGTASLDGRRCCRRSETPRICFAGGTRAALGVHVQTQADMTQIGKKCCPKGYKGCCGGNCCKEFGCCGAKCCPWPEKVCAAAGGREVCCPRAKAVPTEAGWRCCPSGTLSLLRIDLPACCPPNDVTCCGAPHDPKKCGPGQMCVRGTCVAA